MVLLVSDEVRRKNGGPRMVVTGFASGMVECRWRRREAEPHLTLHQRPASVGRFHIVNYFTNRERG